MDVAVEVIDPDPVDDPVDLVDPSLPGSCLDIARGCSERRTGLEWFPNKMSAR